MSRIASNSAFSLMELSLAVVIISFIGTLSLTAGRLLIQRNRRLSARAKTITSPILNLNAQQQTLLMWYESTMPSSLNSTEAEPSTGHQTPVHNLKNYSGEVNIPLINSTDATPPTLWTQNSPMVTIPVVHFSSDNAMGVTTNLRVYYPFELFMVFSPDMSAKSSGDLLTLGNIPLQVSNGNLAGQQLYDGSIYILHLQCNTSQCNGKLYVHQSSGVKISFVATAPTYFEKFYLGSANAGKTLPHYFGEFILFRQWLSEAESQSVVNYLLDKWLD